METPIDPCASPESCGLSLGHDPPRYVDASPRLHHHSKPFLSVGIISLYYPDTSRLLRVILSFPYDTKQAIMTLHPRTPSLAALKSETWQGLERLTLQEEGWQFHDWTSPTFGTHRTHYIEAGSRDKPTLVLVHGFGVSAYHWRANIPELAKHYHVRFVGGYDECTPIITIMTTC